MSKGKIKQVILEKVKSSPNQLQLPSSMHETLLTMRSERVWTVGKSFDTQMVLKCIIGQLHRENVTDLNFEHVIT